MSRKLFHTFMFRVPLNVNKILWVALSDQQSQPQKFPEGKDLWQPTATFWWRREKNFCIQGSLYDQPHLLLSVLGENLKF